MSPRTFLILLVTLLAGAFIGGCAQQETADVLKSIRKKDTLVVGVFGEKPPFGYLDKNGRNAGFDVALARELGRELLGNADKVQFVTLNASNRASFLDSNKVDIVLANFTQTPQRAEIVDFAKPYLKSALGLIGPRNSTITKLKDLQGKIVIVNQGTTGEAFLVNYHPEIKLLRFEHNADAFQALKDGRGAALLHDNLLLFAWTHENQDFKVLEARIGNSEMIAPAVKKGEKALLDWTDAQILRLRKEGFFRRIYEEELKTHFGNSITDPATVLIESDDR